MKVIRQEKLEVSGQTYDAFVAVADNGTDKTIVWLTDTGELLKQNALQSGMRLVRESQEQAERVLVDGGPNLGAINVDHQIPESMRVTELNFRLVGVEDPRLVMQDYRQSVTYDRKAKTATCRVTSKLFDAARALQLPIKGDEYKRWLKPSPGIECDDESIRKIARETVGNETNSYLAATKLRQWVHANIVFEDDRSLPCSALEILKVKHGACRHSATLYAALARAAGIPTRLAVGPWYGTWDGVGNLQSHAWAESFVGEWVPLDAVTEQDFADATHIKLQEGGTEIIGAPYRQELGSLYAEILSYKYRSGHVVKLTGDFFTYRDPLGNLCYFWRLSTPLPRDVPEPAPDSVRAVVPGGWTYYLPPDCQIDVRDGGSADRYIDHPSDHPVIVFANGSTVELPGAVIEGAASLAEREVTVDFTLESPAASAKPSPAAGIVYVTGKFACVRPNGKAFAEPDAVEMAYYRPSPDSVVITEPDGTKWYLPAGSKIGPPSTSTQLLKQCASQLVIVSLSATDKDFAAFTLLAAGAKIESDERLAQKAER